jgi:DNA modification methylase
MMIEGLFQQQTEIGGQEIKRSGPPNRMNDLSYRDWMKFQKSFFFYTNSQALVEECVHFFTKAVWSDGTSSRSLVIGFDDFNARRVIPPRIIEAHKNPKSWVELVGLLCDLAKSNKRYDFLMIDLQRHIGNRRSLNQFLRRYSDKIFQGIENLLVAKRYCGVLVGMEGREGNGFPLSWAVALSSRHHLKLRDEKIGLMKDERRLIYCLFMQADKDQQPTAAGNLEKVRLANTRRATPGWVIPKPPPRKKDEILHPAKYPETLVAEFIKLFTRPGDNVLDPMVGTGSTVLAALRTMRNGFGVDLVPEFVEISKKRIADEFPPMLFHKMASKQKSEVVQGDATRLGDIVELQGVRFNYAITSPPYWSMLTNRGSEYQESRRKKSLPLIYSKDDRDLGNVNDYVRFLELLELVYNQVAKMLVKGGHLTVVAKNIKRQHVVYPLAWDLVSKLCGEGGRYAYVGATLWCQDDVGIKPFAVGIHWVSNTLHHYCLHFRKRLSSQK